MCVEESIWFHIFKFHVKIWSFFSHIKTNLLIVLISCSTELGTVWLNSFPHSVKKSNLSARLNFLPLNPVVRFALSLSLSTSNGTFLGGAYGFCARRYLKLKKNLSINWAQPVESSRFKHDHNGTTIYPFALRDCAIAWYWIFGNGFGGGIYRLDLHRICVRLFNRLT